MKLPTRRTPAIFALLACALLVPAGCKSPNPPAPTPRTSSGSVNQGGSLQLVERSKGSRPERDAKPGDFDFYLLNLSWSPEFCLTHRENPQCTTHPGFVVHGLWPQNFDGTYPENCSGGPALTNAIAFADVMPTASLAEHEWTAHGTCSGLSSDAYFDYIRRAFHSVRIPATFSATKAPPRMLRPDVILAQFAAANPSVPAASFALSCGNNYLTAVEACLDKRLHPIACQSVRSCRANVVKITPR
jgi:ribonuclease T2